MKRKWNAPLWLGFLFALAGFLTYEFFIQFPVTRDFPWANFLLFAIGGLFLFIGLKRAYREPAIYRGKIFGSIFAFVSVLALVFFSFIIFFTLKQLPPASPGTPQVGQKAHDFRLPDQDGKLIGLTDLIAPNSANGKPGFALLIFYRGFW
ncbi:MAG TPA: hypothetical protein VJ719_12795 [Chthoniobacterales bacterium]|nr:hypothetical protein [Chthoniobacterales bacterium]